MYITYNTEQYSDVERWYSEPKYGLFQHTRPPQRFSTLPKPEFMPSKLLRVSDMRVIQGSSVSEGYCALSYSWNWSGEIIVDEVTGTTRRVDHGRHRIIFPAKRVPRRPRGRKRKPRRVKYVQFEGIIQQICKDFNVRYIWYDQWCINQDDKDEKIREIKQMHKVYRNAYCTVALIPEFCSRHYLETKPLKHQPNYPKLYTSQWMRRVWTLEEALLSQRILFVGQDIHSWWYLVQRVANLHTLCQKQPVWNVSTILYYAHIRTTTKEHDRVFALANLLPDIMSSITVNYDQPIDDLLLHFYGLLAQKDISILCFGCHKDYTRIGRPKDDLAEATDVSFQLKELLTGAKLRQRQPYTVPIQTHCQLLPTWTGVQGEHILPLRHEYSDYPKTTFKSYTVNGEFMHVTSTSLPSNKDAHDRWFSPFEHKDLPLVPQGPSHDVNGEEVRWILCISVQFPGKDVSKILNLLITHAYELPIYDQKGLNKSLHDKLWHVAQFVPIKKENLFWWNAAWSQEAIACFEDFSLTERVYAVSDVVILSGVQFKDNWPDRKRFPVIVRDKTDNRYRAIGTCRVANPEYFFSGVVVPEETFVIK
ncbi:hypothetical protein BDB00DRAFT_933074 [Zychaea mexicana]|uniref:uncharacterized protein n=1 Tax=Zychaea mexicana TaxID=64656 RepID=UPI0022FDF36E|nr:uncharacterized protein BDB00DRAFT_933074 [Zychaea mexicana]KAI9488003.1 hypothetical protein BDB00DRAFT_933074 [Zychaea mexicana]